jgi:hypothetical protein
MNSTRIAVLGLYRSGSTVVAGVLHHLGVDMGAPFYGGYYESDWVSKQLRIWWDERGELQEKVQRPKRVKVLAEWVKEREAAGARWVGIKHPLLSLCGEDLVQAWGEETRFIRCCRPLEESVKSMKIGMGYKGDAELRQRTLLDELDRFLAGRPHLQVGFSDMMEHPEEEIKRMIEFLEIAPEPERIAVAVQSVTPGKHAKVEAERRQAKRASKRYQLKQFFKNLVNNAEGRVSRVEGEGREDRE